MTAVHAPLMQQQGPAVTGAQGLQREAAAARAWPVAVTDHTSSGRLDIEWDDGQVSRLPHALLRRHCRCAACEQQRRCGAASADLPSDLRLTGIEAVGDQGLNLAFSDGHRRGIYPWVYLRQLAGAV